MYEFIKEWGPQILSTGVLSGAFATFFSSWLQQRQNKKNNGIEVNYAAFRLANMFEDYAVECARRIQDVYSYYASNGIHGAPYGDIPELESFPSDIDWKVFDPILADSTLAFPRQVRLSNDTIDFVFRDGNPDEPEDGAAEFRIQCGVRGFQAWELACKIREHYKLALRAKLADNWDVVGDLKTEYDKYEERLRQLSKFKKPTAMNLK